MNFRPFHFKGGRIYISYELNSLFTDKKNRQTNKQQTDSPDVVKLIRFSLQDHFPFSFDIYPQQGFKLLFIKMQMLVIKQ